MRPLTAAVAGLLVGAVAMGAVVWAADRDDPESATDREVAVDQIVPGEVCDDLLPDGAFEALGWAGAAAPAVVDGQRCRRTHGKDGYILVGERPRGGDLSVDGVRKAYDERCESLDAGSGPATWITGHTACAEVSDEGAGVSDLYLLTEKNRIVQIRITALADTEPAEVRDALSRLVDAAATVY